MIDRTLTEEMIQAKDGILVEGAEQDPVEFPGRSPIAPERFFDNYARTVAAARFSKLLDDHCEGSGRDSQVENRVFSASERLAKGLVGYRGRIVALHVAQQGTQRLVRLRVDSPMLLKTGPSPRPQFVHIFGRPRHADHRHVEVAAFNHGLQSWEDLLESKIPSRTEKNECVRMGNSHCAPVRFSQNLSCRCASVKTARNEARHRTVSFLTSILPGCRDLRLWRWRSVIS